MVKVLEFVPEVSNFKIQTHRYVHFQTNTLKKLWTSI